MWLSLGSISAIVYQISSKSDNFFTYIWRFNDFQIGCRPLSWIFEIDSFCHVAFIGMSFCSSYKILLKSDNRLMTYDQKKRFATWRPSTILNFINFNFSSRGCHRVQYLPYVRQITILKIVAVRHLGFSKLAFFLSRGLSRHAILLPRTKFRSVMAKKRFATWRPFATLNFKNFSFWSCECHLVQYLL